VLSYHSVYIQVNNYSIEEYFCDLHQINGFISHQSYIYPVKWWWKNVP